MADRKDVRRFSLSALAAFIDQVSEPQAVATLQVSDGFSERVIYFAAGGVRLISVGERGTPDIPSYLLDAGKIDVEKLHEVLERVRTSDLELRQVLEETKVLTADEFGALSRRFIRDEIFDLVFWDDTYYKVYPTSPPQSIFSKDRNALTGQLHFVELAEDVNRWITDWKRHRKVLISDESKLYLTSRGRKVLKTSLGLEREVLQLCGEGPSVRQLRRRTDLELPQLCTLLSTQVEDGAIKLLRGEWNRNKSVEGSIEALEASLERVIDKELVQEKLAHLYSKSKQSNKATEQLVQLAREALGRDDLEGAEKLWEKIVALKSPNLDALQLFASAYAKRELAREVSKVAFQYASAVSQGGYSGVGEEVASVLRKLSGGKLPALEFQANWLSSKGRLREAGDTYCRVTRLYEESGDFESAIAVAKKGVDCDPNNTQLGRMLSELREKHADLVAQGQIAGDPGHGAVKKSAGEGVNSKVLVVLVAVVVVGGMHFAGIFDSIAAAGSGKTESPQSTTQAVKLPGHDEEFLPGAGVVPQQGSKGLDVREAFQLNEADGTVSTPLGIIKMPGGSGGGAAGLPGGGGSGGGLSDGGSGGSGGAPNDIPFKPFDPSSGLGASDTGGGTAITRGSRSQPSQYGTDGFGTFANGPSLPYVGRRPGEPSKVRTDTSALVGRGPPPGSTPSAPRSATATSLIHTLRPDGGSLTGGSPQANEPTGRSSATHPGR